MNRAWRRQDGEAASWLVLAAALAAIATLLGPGLTGTYQALAGRLGEPNAIDLTTSTNGGTGGEGSAPGGAPDDDNADDRDGRNDGRNDRDDRPDGRGPRDVVPGRGGADGGRDGRDDTNGGRDGRGPGDVLPGGRGDGASGGGAGSTGSGGSTSGPQSTPPGLPDPPPPPPAPAVGDGSGEHGSKGRNILQEGKDRAVKELAQALADAADSVGYDNAAAHLRHYLDNSGDDLFVDPAAIMRDDADFANKVQDKIDFELRDLIDAEIAESYDGEPISFQVTTDWSSTNLQDDWFYAIGGVSYSVGAEVTITPGPDGTPIVTVRHQTHIFDRYNWDKGKAVTIGPITIQDEQLGHLHEVGIAQEFDIYGSTDVDTFEYEYAG